MSKDERADADAPKGGDSGGGKVEQPRARQPKGKAKSHSGGFAETIKTVVYAVLIALVVRTFLIEPFSIPSRSMLPTLLVSDYLFVNKYVYGYSRYSLPFSPKLWNGRLLTGTPKRGDVVVFRHPVQTYRDYIKRVIGLPGDRIQLKQGRLYINGTIVKREPAGQQVDTVRRVTGDRGGAQVLDKPYTVTYQRYRETLPGGVTHIIFERGDFDSFPDNTDVFVVPKGKFFAMGDNRDNSQDSRFFGYVPMENIVGRADFIFFSLREDKFWWQIWHWPVHIRYSRLFKSVD